MLTPPGKANTAGVFVRISTERAGLAVDKIHSAPGLLRDYSIEVGGISGHAYVMATKNPAEKRADTEIVVAVARGKEYQLILNDDSNFSGIQPEFETMVKKGILWKHLVKHEYRTPDGRITVEIPEGFIVVEEAGAKDGDTLFQLVGPRDERNSFSADVVVGIRSLSGDFAHFLQRHRDCKDYSELVLTAQFRDYVVFTQTPGKIESEHDVVIGGRPGRQFRLTASVNAIRRGADDAWNFSLPPRVPMTVWQTFVLLGASVVEVTCATPTATAANYEPYFEHIRKTIVFAEGARTENK